MNSGLNSENCENAFEVLAKAKDKSNAEARF